MAIIAMGLIFLIAAVHNSSKVGALVYGTLGALTAAVGAGIAARHLYLQYTAQAGAVPACGPEGVDGLLYLVETFGTTSALRKVFYPTGDCATVDWTFIGLSMPGWVLIWFVALGALAVVATRRSRL
jgi:disulfide bond formation protein DsbB